MPQHWRIEVASLGRKAVRKGNLTLSELEIGLATLARAPVQHDPETTIHIWTTTLGLAHKHDLTVYDAAYLELVLRRRLPLLSNDTDLRDAVNAEGARLQDT